MNFLPNYERKGIESFCTICYDYGSDDINRLIKCSKCSRLHHQKHYNSQNKKWIDVICTENKMIPFEPRKLSFLFLEGIDVNSYYNLTKNLLTSFGSILLEEDITIYKKDINNEVDLGEVVKGIPIVDVLFFTIHGIYPGLEDKEIFSNAIDLKTASYDFEQTIGNCLKDNCPKEILIMNMCYFNFEQKLDKLLNELDCNVIYSDSSIMDTDFLVLYQFILLNLWKNTNIIKLVMQQDLFQKNFKFHVKKALLNPIKEIQIERKSEKKVCPYCHKENCNLKFCQLWIQQNIK